MGNCFSESATGQKYHATDEPDHPSIKITEEVKAPLHLSLRDDDTNIDAHDTQRPSLKSSGNDELSPSNNAALISQNSKLLGSMHDELSDIRHFKPPTQGSFTMQSSPTMYLSNQQRVQRGRARRASLPDSLKAELAAIADQQTGQLNKSYSKHLSRISMASVTTDATGAVIVYEPGLEDSEGPVKLTRLIGKGGCGRVYTGEWNKEVVAVKVAVGYQPDGEDPDEELIAALEVKRERMTQLEAVLMSKLHHPNIVKTHRIISCAPGIAAAAGPDDIEALKRIKQEGYVDAEHIPSTYRWYIIMEYAPLGSLWQGLRHGRFHRQVGPGQTSVLGWDVWAALEVLLEIASAMHYLAENNVIHGDLKAANILLISSNKDRRGYISKVTDFGFSRILGSNEISTKSKGTVTHMPPELLQEGRLIPACDVFSFGITMWEVLTAQHVYQGISDSQVVCQVVQSNLRPPFPVDAPPRYKELSRACTAMKPEDRPRWKDILDRLNSMRAEICPMGPDSGMVLMRRGGKSRRASLQTYMIDHQQGGQGAKMLQMLQAGKNGRAGSRSQNLEPV
ncbi:hypothetical protein CEUSTIGMA_g1334.t1 [Chlamydomonas eustigma]|uniref:Protein kinase domain-containing protein n=1 Tax=Chlamydomonas eustigma TaxID=1157962 RepID=A0A250WSS5_9CHLO|nr:hypothetical protein CEUSTIGMA_g1334.t1 [Chlamydomonas eustigma]|eukprot:GAX73884.1 hypothetical protein CEUSTIGMA_g1334.t1 [Chlamydomonas eustigma]